MADSFVYLVGNLTDDPDLRYTPTGQAVANFRLAVTPRVQDGGQWKDADTSFFRVNLWRDQAEHLAESVGKGDRLLVAGRLRQRTWQDKTSGEQRSIVEVDADEVGPSLKFATAKPQRTSRKATGNGEADA